MDSWHVGVRPGGRVNRGQEAEGDTGRPRWTSSRALTKGQSRRNRRSALTRRRMSVPRSPRSFFDRRGSPCQIPPCAPVRTPPPTPLSISASAARSEEHTSELQSRGHLVCRLLLEKKKRKPHRTDQ